MASKTFSDCEMKSIPIWNRYPIRLITFWKYSLNIELFHWYFFICSVDFNTTDRFDHKCCSCLLLWKLKSDSLYIFLLSGNLNLTVMKHKLDNYSFYFEICSMVAPATIYPDRYWCNTVLFENTTRAQEERQIFFNWGCLISTLHRLKSKHISW